MPVARVGAIIGATALFGGGFFAGKALSERGTQPGSQERKRRIDTVAVGGFAAAAIGARLMWHGASTGRLGMIVASAAAGLLGSGAVAAAMITEASPAHGATSTGR